jgi:hypothetical protein
VETDFRQERCHGTGLRRSAVRAPRGRLYFKCASGVLRRPGAAGTDRHASK